MRAWKVGAGVVEPWELDWGHDDSQFAPPEYGEYIATSNAVFACATLRADTLSGIPLRALRKDGKKRVEVSEGPVVDLMQKVNGFWTMNRLLTMTELSLCLWGKNYWAVERGTTTRGEPQEIWWMRPDRVKVIPHPTRYVAGYVYEPVNGAAEIFFEPHEVVWFRYPNPLDEFAGLSPLAAARLAADLSSAAQSSNMNLFRQGYQPGGYIIPPKGVTLTKDQADILMASIDRRFKGVDKAHRWAVLRFEAEMKSANVTPKDAEFLGTLTWSLEEVARAYKVPLDMIGGQRTYENVQAAERAFWYRTMEPESRFIASEIVEQLLPMFGVRNRVDLVEFDLSRVPILQDAESERWARDKERITTGVLLMNEYREREGLDTLAWGDVWWAPVGLTPVSSAMVETGGTEEEERGIGRKTRANHPARRMVEWGGEEHERLFKRFEGRVKSWESRIGKATAEVMRAQRESVIDRLKQEMGERAFELEDVLKIKEWIARLRKKIRPEVKWVVEQAGNEALRDLGLGLTFDVAQPAVARYIERRAQRFAEEVNQTTWDRLRKSLSEGLEAGEGLDKLIARVEDVMADRIRSSGEVIARTETVGASNGGTMEAWKQSEVVERKAWLSALLPERTRDSHAEAHDRYQAAPIPLDEDFEVGSGRGPHPGAIGVAEEDINCLCSMQAIIKQEEE